MWAEIRPLTEKQRKYIQWQKNMDAARERGRKKYAEKQITSWSNKDKKVFSKLEKVVVFYLYTMNSPGLKKDERRALSFASGMMENIKTWGKPLSEKQAPFVEKAYEIVLDKCELLV